MKPIFPFMLALLVSASAFSQQAPAHRSGSIQLSVPGPYGRPVPDSPLRRQWEPGPDNDVEVVGIGANSGDELVVRTADGNEHVIILADVIAPVRGQQAFSLAQLRVAELVSRRDLILRVKGYSAERVPVAWVYDRQSGESINEEVLRQGLAWVYRQNVTDPHLIMIEDEARVNRLGIFKRPGETPWDFQQKQSEARNRAMDGRKQ